MVHVGVGEYTSLSMFPMGTRYKAFLGVIKNNKKH